jgi:hypothetical protein
MQESSISYRELVPPASCLSLAGDFGGRISYRNKRASTPDKVKGILREVLMRSPADAWRSPHNTQAVVAGHWLVKNARSSCQLDSTRPARSQSPPDLKSASALACLLCRTPHIGLVTTRSGTSGRRHSAQLPWCRRTAPPAWAASMHCLASTRLPCTHPILPSRLSRRRSLCHMVSRAAACSRHSRLRERKLQGRARTSSRLRMIEIEHTTPRQRRCQQ